MLSSYHLRPASGWINDPNGLTFHDGRWHVFYQHNPAGPVHGDIHWGHASSVDLVVWEHHPVAFGPQTGGPDAGGCWSGVFVPGLDRPAVVYSGVVASAADATVCLRWGSPDLLSWGAPQVVAEPPPGVREMRDPFVFDWEARRFALVGAGLHDGTAALLLFDASEITAWRYVGVVARADAPVFRTLPPSDVWECPQLCSVDGVTVLILSLCTHGAPPGPVVWVAVDIDAASYGADRRVRVEAGPQLAAIAWGLVDTGPNFYAPQVMTDDEEPMLIGWIPSRTPHDPDVPVAGCLTLPRRLAWQDGALVSRIDSVAAQALTGSGAGQEVGSGRHTLPGAARADVPAGRLTSSSDPALSLQLTDAEVWVDADVVEVYPAGGPAWTARGTGKWLLEIPEDLTGTLQLLV